MSEAYEFSYRINKEELYEGLLAHNSKMIRWPSKAPIFVISIINSIFIAVGGLTLGLVAKKLVTGAATGGALWSLAGIAIAYFSCAFAPKAILKTWARSLIQSPGYQRDSIIRLSNQGVRSRNELICYEAGWSTVSRIIVGRRAIHILASGLVFSLPKTVFDDLALQVSLLEQVKLWREAANGGAS